MNRPYQFAFHERVPSTPPAESDFKLVSSRQKLSREQKDRIFHKLQSNSGGSNYRLSGWVFPFGTFMKTFLVKYKYEPNVWREIKAFDKTCIRSSYHTNSNIVEIVELPRP